MASHTINIDEEIFPDLQKFYGEIYSLPPLAARIYAFLIFDFEKNGTTFDDLVEYFGASKSSVSAAINLLLQHNLIVNSVHGNERKRYFVLNDEFVKIRFMEIVERMQAEVDLLDRIQRFRNTEDEHISEKYGIYKSLLNNNIVNIKDSLRKLYNEE